MWEIWVEMELGGAKGWFYLFFNTPSACGGELHYTVPAILNSLVTEILQTSSVIVPGSCI